MTRDHQHYPISSPIASNDGNPQLMWFCWLCLPCRKTSKSLDDDPPWSGRSRWHVTSNQISGSCPKRRESECLVMDRASLVFVFEFEIIRDCCVWRFAFTFDALRFSFLWVGRKVNGGQGCCVFASSVCGCERLLHSSSCHWGQETHKRDLWAPGKGEETVQPLLPSFLYAFSGGELLVNLN